MSARYYIKTTADCAQLVDCKPKWTRYDYPGSAELEVVNDSGQLVLLLDPISFVGKESIRLPELDLEYEHDGEQWMIRTRTIARELAAAEGARTTGALQRPALMALVWSVVWNVFATQGEAALALSAMYIWVGDGADVMRPTLAALGVVAVYCGLAILLVLRWFTALVRALPRIDFKYAVPPAQKGAAEAAMSHFNRLGTVLPLLGVVAYVTWAAIAAPGWEFIVGAAGLGVVANLVWHVRWHVNDPILLFVNHVAPEVLQRLESIRQRSWVRRTLVRLRSCAGVEIQVIEAYSVIKTSVMTLVGLALASVAFSSEINIALVLFVAAMVFHLFGRCIRLWHQLWERDLSRPAQRWRLVIGFSVNVPTGKEDDSGVGVSVRPGVDPNTVTQQHTIYRAQPAD